MTDEVERRLRRALTARAGQITAERLRVEPPPTAATAVAPMRRGWWAVIAIGTAAAGVALAFTVFAGASDPTPVLPADPGPGTSPPAPAGSPSRLFPSPPEPSAATATKPVTSAPSVTASKPTASTSPTTAEPRVTPGGE